MATTTVKYFKKEHLKVINRIAKRLNYNRTLPDELIDTMDDEYKYPIILTFVHEHAQGKPVDPHMRCMFSALNISPTSLIIDTPMELYYFLPEATVELPDKK